ncbi:hypothetical protein [Terasakiella pusilla]|uniref:hypothetical protein n=1 Tax=Terasakiella pusilla TaxID=64973 RepID=UPI003AA82E2E
MSIQFITANPAAERRKELQQESRLEQQASIRKSQEDRAAKQFSDDQDYQATKYDYYSGKGLGGIGNGYPSEKPSLPEGIEKASINNFRTPSFNGNAGSQNPAPTMTQADIERASINSLNKPRVNKVAAGRFLEELNKINYNRSQDAQRQIDADRGYQLRADARQDDIEREAMQALKAFGQSRDPAAMVNAQRLFQKAGMKWNPSFENPTHSYAHSNAMLLAEKLFKGASNQEIAKAYQVAYKSILGGADTPTAMQAMNAAVGAVSVAPKPSQMMKAMDMAHKLLQDDPDYIGLPFNEKLLRTREMAGAMLGVIPNGNQNAAGSNTQQAGGGQMNANAPAGMPSNAQQGKDGNWYIPDPQRPGKWLMLREKGSNGAQTHAANIQAKPLSDYVSLIGFSLNGGRYTADQIREENPELYAMIAKAKAMGGDVIQNLMQIGDEQTKLFFNELSQYNRGARDLRFDMIRRLADGVDANFVQNAASVPQGSDEEVMRGVKQEEDLRVR